MKDLCKVNTFPQWWSRSVLKELSFQLVKSVALTITLNFILINLDILEHLQVN